MLTNRLHSSTWGIGRLDFLLMLIEIFIFVLVISFYKIRNNTRRYSTTTLLWKCSNNTGFGIGSNMLFGGCRFPTPFISTLILFLWSNFFLWFYLFFGFFFCWVQLPALVSKDTLVLEEVFTDRKLVGETAVKPFCTKSSCEEPANCPLLVLVCRNIRTTAGTGTIIICPANKIILYCYYYWQKQQPGESFLFWLLHTDLSMVTLVSLETE